MNDSSNGSPAGRGPLELPNLSTDTPPLRTWPVWILVPLIPLSRFGPALFEDGRSQYWMIAVFGPTLCCLLMVLWWLLASRATWRERLLGFLGLVTAVVVTYSLVDPSMRGAGINYFAMPIAMSFFGLSALRLARHSPLRRTGGILAATVAGLSVSSLLRTEGMTGDYVFTAKWRWTPTTEEQQKPRPIATSSLGQAIQIAATHIEALRNPTWPGFRGVDRSGRVHEATRFATNWSARPPRQLWKIPVGPGWSSFALAGTLLYTQEQRGISETVVCYDANTGQELWTRAVEARFDEPLGGPGPRATPTLGGGKLFTTGATGIMLRLDPLTGEILWQKDLKTLAGRDAPMWGFSASPLVVGSLVIQYAAGSGTNGLVALDVESGNLRWATATGIDSYSSPQLTHVAGDDFVLMLTNEGLSMVEPTTGLVRFNHPAKLPSYRALQPQWLEPDTLLIPTPMNEGTKALRIRKAAGTFNTEELWNSKHLKTDFSDFVVLDGYAYGVDGGIFTCIDLKSGMRRWKGGRYGKGQVIALLESKLLLVAAESGHAVLLAANPDEHVELGSFKAIEGKTWNHPIVAGHRLYLRNSEEAACLELP